MSTEDWWVSAWNKSNGQSFLIWSTFAKILCFSSFVSPNCLMTTALEYWNTSKHSSWRVDWLSFFPCFTTSQVTLVCCGSIFCVYGEARLEFLAPPMAGKLKRLESIPHYRMLNPGVTNQARMISNDGFSNSGIVCKAFSAFIPIFSLLTLMFCLLQVLEPPMGVLSFRSTSLQYLAKLHMKPQWLRCPVVSWPVTMGDMI